MIVFGCAVTAPEKYARFALSGIRRASEPDTVVIDHDSRGTISNGYNAILERAREVEGLEALVLIHQDLEITSPDFPARIRACLADPEVAIVGAAGAPNVRGLDWWEPGPVIADYSWSYERAGGGIVSMNEWTNHVPAEGLHRVEAVDGMILVLSPWAVRELRFDEQIDPSAHGYDVDLCLQARAAGKSVVVASLGVTHHHELEVMTDSQRWIATHMRLAEKWEGRLEAEPNGDWRQRARRAEAEAGAAKIARDELNLLRNEADRRAIRFWDRIVLLERRLETVKRIAAPFKGAAGVARRTRERISRGDRVL